MLYSFDISNLKFSDAIFKALCLEILSFTQTLLKIFCVSSEDDTDSIGQFEIKTFTASCEKCF